VALYSTLEKPVPASDGGLRRLFRKYLPAIHWTTIESRYTESGIPDLNGCFAGREFWIECKVTKHWKVILRPMQAAWIKRHIRCGGICYIAVRRRNKSDDELWLLDGDAVNDWNDGIYGSALLKCGGGPANWPWQAVAAALGVVLQPANQGKAAPTAHPLKRSAL
jgi:hypothetical protein